MRREVEGNKLVRSISRIQLKNFDVPTVSQQVSNLLRLYVSEVEEISEVVHQRTEGTLPEHVAGVQLALLNLPEYKWMWDIVQI